MDLAYNWFLTYKIPIQAMKYQIAQTTPTDIVVYLTKGLYQLTQTDINMIKESLYSLVERDMNVRIEFTDNFIQTSGKFKPVINLIG